MHKTGAEMHKTRARMHKIWARMHKIWSEMHKTERNILITDGDVPIDRALPVWSCIVYRQKF